MPFRMEAAAKRAATCAPEPPKRSRVAPPAAAALKDLDLPKRAAPQTIPSSATMTAVIYKVSDCAGDSVQGYVGTQAGLFEVMMEHAACPSILYRTRSEFDGFLRNAHHTAAGDAPASLEELDTMAGQPSSVLAAVLYITRTRASQPGIMLHQAPTNDPDAMGYATFSTRWQIVGDEGSRLACTFARMHEHPPCDATPGCRCHAQLPMF